MFWEGFIAATLRDACEVAAGLETCVFLDLESLAFLLGEFNAGETIGRRFLAG